MLSSTTTPRKYHRGLRSGKPIEPGASFDRAKEQKRLEDLVKSIEKEDHQNNIKRYKEELPTSNWSIESLRLQNSTLKQATNVTQDKKRKETSSHGHGVKQATNVTQDKKRKKTSNHGHGVCGDGHGQPFTVDYCHVYKSTKKSSLSSLLTQRAFKLGIQAIEREFLKQAKGPKRKDDGIDNGKSQAGFSNSRGRRTRAKNDKVKGLKVGDCIEDQPDVLLLCFFNCLPLI
jgi:hypothetical protein